jgi:hypothetical protein
MSKTTDKILKLSKKAAADKIAEQKEQLENRVSQDIKVIETILEMVADRLVYKEIGLPHSSRKSFVVVTEDIVLQDYNTKPEYGSGTSIKRQEATYYSYPHTIIRVNGHKYYHAADLITRYKYDAQKAMEKSEAEYEAAKKRKEAIEDLEFLEPLMKELMLNYQKTLGKYQVES